MYAPCSAGPDQWDPVTRFVPCRQSQTSPARTPRLQSAGLCLGTPVGLCAVPSDLPSHTVLHASSYTAKPALSRPPTLSCFARYFSMTHSLKLYSAPIMAKPLAYDLYDNRERTTTR